MKNLILFLILVSLTKVGFSQTSDGSTCNFSTPFCSDSSYTFPNASGGSTTAPTGPDYGCLFSEPNPIWYYFQIGTAGPMQMTLSQTSPSGPIDVDFAMWGPFTLLDSACPQIMTGTLPPLQCSYSALPTETIGLGMPGGSGSGASTPPSPSVGEIYVLLITNFSGVAGTLSLSQTAGTGATDCNIICDLSISNSGPVCQNEYVTLTANEVVDTAHYLWTGPGGFTSTLQNPSVLMTTAGSFDFSCRSIIGVDTCFRTTTVVVNPTYSFNNTVNICAGSTYSFYGEMLSVPGTYAKAFKTIKNCDSIYTLKLNINPKPNVEVNHSPLEICYGEVVRMSAASPNTTNTYSWTRNGIVIPGANSFQHIDTIAGEYRLIATTNNNCTDSSKKMKVVVNPAATATILPISTTYGEICIGDSIKLKAQEYPRYEYRWSPEKYFRYTEGYRSSQVTAVVTDVPSLITLTAINEFGCTDTSMISITPKPCCEVLMPTVFSPNGDGLNDYFNIKMNPGQVILNFQVFDRYGNMVYNNTNPKLGWDGTHLGKGLAEQGTYFYRVLYSCTDGKNYDNKGDVVLVR